MTAATLTARDFVQIIITRVMEGQDGRGRDWYVFNVSDDSTDDGALIVDVAHGDGTRQRFVVACMDVTDSPQAVPDVQ